VAVCSPKRQETFAILYCDISAESQNCEANRCSFFYGTALITTATANQRLITDHIVTKRDTNEITEELLESVFHVICSGSIY
jgi:hypothetical protein